MGCRQERKCRGEVVHTCKQMTRVSCMFTNACVVFFCHFAELTAPPALCWDAHGISCLQAAGRGSGWINKATWRNNRLFSSSKDQHIPVGSTIGDKSLFPSWRDFLTTELPVRVNGLKMFCLTWSQHPTQLQRQPPHWTICRVCSHVLREGVSRSYQQPVKTHTLQVIPGIWRYNPI